MKIYKFLSIIIIASLTLVACSNKDKEDTVPDSTVETQLESEKETQEETEKETLVESSEESKEETVVETKETVKETDEETVKETQEETVVETKEETAKETQEETTKEASEYQWIYDELEGKKFTFSSGAGAWSTDVKFGKNGELEGVYHDTNMGEAEGPTVHLNHFSAKLKINALIYKKTYTMSIENLKNLNEKYKNQDDDVAENDTEKLIKNYVDKPYGFEETNTFTLFLPYADVSDHEDEFKMWIENQISDLKKIDRFVIKNDAKSYGIVEYIETNENQ